MISGLLSLFGGSAAKAVSYLVAVLAIIAAAFFAYKWAYNNGYEKGVADTVAKYQPVIDKFNRQTAERNLKISELESDSKIQAEQISILKKGLTAEVTASHNDFVAKNPTIAKNCAVAKPTTDAYNQFLSKVLNK